MLQINGKTFMNIQEAVQWLLDNNALPFQSTANYAGNTEIGMGTIVNPSPAKVRIGSLIFFADSKVSTVTGITENGFIVSDQYNDLVDDVVYVSGVGLNGSGHLLVTLSNGTIIDAGLIKQVNSFSINGSQHLIVSYNDGTSTDLGAIFQGNINISGNITASGLISSPSIIQSMVGYSYTHLGTTTDIYVGVCQNGNKLTIVYFASITQNGTLPSTFDIAQFNIPSAVASKLYPFNVAGYDFLDVKDIYLINKDTYDTTQKLQLRVIKGTNALYFRLANATSLSNGTYYLRIELTFLLSDSMS